VTRLPLVSPETTEDPILASIFGEIHKRGLDVPNLYQTLANAPQMLKAWVGFTWPLRHQAATPRLLRELAIMRVSQIAQAPYPWSHHWPMAVEAGLSDGQLAHMDATERANWFDDVQRATLGYTDEVVAGDVGAGTMAEADRFFSPAEIVELTLATTFYLNLACFSKALQIPLEPEYEQYAERLPVV